MNWFARMLIASPREAPSLPAQALLIDVRTEGEYARGHVDGAVNLPLDRFAREVETLVPDKDAPVVLYCMSGARSGSACDLMRKLSYRQVTNGGSAGALALRVDRPIRRRD
jgi:phage shock protein E